MESIYKSITPEEKQELLSRFIISSWSYSKVRTFARNQAAFEMNYIFGEINKSSATTIAGNAYHKALQAYFIAKTEGRALDLVEMEETAFEEINEVHGNKWKLSKTMPTIEESKEKALKTVSALLRNFLSEKATYEDDIDQVLAVELFCEEWVTVNRVDIPLPCKSIIDLVVLTKAGNRAIVDHKSKQAFTSEAEIVLGVGKQAITYVLIYEAITGQRVDEVWFVENKYSQNKDKSPQLNKYVIPMDEDTRALYEAKLYEPLKCMIEAVSNPDHIYIANDDDNFVDQAELNNFWARMQISEISDLNLEESKADLIRKRIKKIRDASAASVSPAVIKKYQQNASKFINYDLSNKDMTSAEKIEHVLRTHGIQVRVAHQFNGYSSATFLLEIGAGVKINSIPGHRLDIANALDVENVRIAPELKKYEGKAYVAIDFKKKNDGILLFDPKELVGCRIPLGKDNFNNTLCWDHNNPNTPHAMFCGSTGSGKSVSMRGVIEYCWLYGPDKLVILDPKGEFLHLEGDNVEVHQDIEVIEEVVQGLVVEMRDLIARRQQKRIVIIFDEFAEAVANSRKGPQLKVYETICEGLTAKGLPKMKRVHTDTLKSLEENIRILAQLGRSVGVRIGLGVQRASTEIITGDAKVNFPVQVCFRVKSQIDSKVVLDEAGAEGLAGNGDGLIKSPEYLNTERFQAFFIDPKQGLGEYTHIALAHHDEEVNATIVTA